MPVAWHGTHLPEAPILVGFIQDACGFCWCELTVSQTEFQCVPERSQNVVSSLQGGSPGFVGPEAETIWRAQTIKGPHVLEGPWSLSVVNLVGSLLAW